MICARRVCGEEFKAKRRHQRYCSKRCRQKAYDERVPLKRVRRRERTATQGRESVERRLLKARDMESAQRRRAMPLEANSRFTHQAAPGNIKGLLARVAVTAPQAMLKLAASLKEDKAAGRPSCIGCAHACADGAPCVILAAG